MVSRNFPAFRATVWRNAKIVSATGACVWRNAFPSEEPMRPASHYPPNRKNAGNQRYPN
jgi:hypothetical protein